MVFVDLLLLSDLAQRSEELLNSALANPGPLTLALVFGGGALTSLGPCSLSLLPVTLAYLAGFEDGRPPWQRSLAFCGGIVGALVILGSLSGMIGRIYGQVPALIPSLVAVLAIVMGLNLLGVLRIPLPAGPDPENWRSKVPAPLAPVAAGLAFGVAASPCTTPVLAVLLGWIAQRTPPCRNGTAHQLWNRSSSSSSDRRNLRGNRPQIAGVAIVRSLGATYKWCCFVVNRIADLDCSLDLTTTTQVIV